MKLNILLNTSLNGLTMDQINLTTIAKIKEEAGIHSEVVNSVLDAVAEAIQMDEEEMEIIQAERRTSSNIRNYQTVKRRAA